MRFVKCILIVSLLYLFFSSNKSFGQQHKLVYRLDLVLKFKSQFHIQGIAVDSVKRAIYGSYTDCLVKFDFDGNVLGLIRGFNGHLGDIDMDPETGKLYASVEYKNDVIGKGIQSVQANAEYQRNAFYVLIFDTWNFPHSNLIVKDVDIVKAVYLSTVVEDYEAKIKVGDQILNNRFGCSGIDGLALAPDFKVRNPKLTHLYLAYGIYGDATRSDNDHQIILKYDIKQLETFAKPFDQLNWVFSGPKAPDQKLFIKTGNTRYGIQNLTYDKYNKLFLAAVYKGNKPNYPNYDLFTFSSLQEPKKMEIFDGETSHGGFSLNLYKTALKEKGSNIYGWNFPLGSTGMQPIFKDRYYFSEPWKDEEGLNGSTLRLYFFNPIMNSPFTYIKPPTL